MPLHVRCQLRERLQEAGSETGSPPSSARTALRALFQMGSAGFDRDLVNQRRRQNQP